MIRYHAVPGSLLAAESDFSGCLRAGSQKDGTYLPGVKLYRKVVREHVINVFHSVFPIFCRSLENDEINQFADAFIIQHQATQPEFHQLATELLLFMRKRPEVLTDDQRVIEYEWLIYALEIDESDVPLPHIKRAAGLDIHNMDVIMNPTLRMVVLPFQLNDGEPSYEDEPCEYYYALYRKHDNMLYQKKLNITDVKLLLEVGKAGVTAEMLIEKASSHLTTQPFEQWLAANNNDEVISLIIKG
uniref:Putative DNA-binding domain-containing protein n=1 Tax=Pectobacterium carotovorum TaxID=554 RepID=A0A0N9NRE9_PECCA|nr:putative DNA-binding domain-containing protein [Pectobacterium carotovorum]ALG88621.1 Hypothetical protein [Pectobacterium carotovorum]